MLLFALYLVLGRRNRDFPSLWLYMVPLYAIAALSCYALSFLFVSPFEEQYPLREVGFILGLGLIPTIFGHSILNLAMKHLRGQVVTLANLSQPIFAGLLAFLFLSEVPALSFYPACLLIIAGALTAFRN
jgi:drug/metabolite transporter (DMT)-like permease